MTLKDIVNRRIENYLPVELEASEMDSALTGKKIFISISPKRSGQHAILNWLCSQIGEVIHFNNCHFLQKNLVRKITPITGRVIHYENGHKNDIGTNGSKVMKEYLNVHKSPATLLYSLEDFSIERKGELKKVVKDYEPTFLFILRDPYNWLASSMAHTELGSAGVDLKWKVRIFKEIAKHVMNCDSFLGRPFFFINYNSWYNDEEYRKDVCKRLNFNFVDDSARSNVPDFGGGSSFENTKFDGNANKMSVMERWKSYRENSSYLHLINDKELHEIGNRLFHFEFPK